MIMHHQIRNQISQQKLMCSSPTKFRLPAYFRFAAALPILPAKNKPSHIHDSPFTSKGNASFKHWKWQHTWILGITAISTPAHASEWFTGPFHIIKINAIILKSQFQTFILWNQHRACMPTGAQRKTWHLPMLTLQMPPLSCLWKMPAEQHQLLNH